MLCVFRRNNFPVALLVSAFMAFWGFGGMNCIAGTTQSFSLKDGSLWYPYLEWTLSNPGFKGNPYDIVARVTFVHIDSGETRKTEMFYDGNNIWKFRFTGTRIGKWTFTTSSDLVNLNGKSGSVIIKPNNNKNAHGFVKNFGSKWGWEATESAFVPQFVMYHSPEAYHQKPKMIDTDINNFIKDHGFTGFHTLVFCRWFDINKEKYSRISSDDPNPDRRTFQALELLITKTHQAGGSVHIWAWGDEERRQTPKKWGLNGKVDKRLQRYIAARLGPLPGWTMGYGFDLWEWVKENDLKQWHAYMHRNLGWHHFLGGRASKNTLEQIYEGLDYSGYEQHRPDYNKYVETIEKRPDKPSFSEDRYRIQKHSRFASKDYTAELVRRGLWHSAMAGGVANIWGNLTARWGWVGELFGNLGLKMGLLVSKQYSQSFPNKEQIKTYSVFIANYFRKGLKRSNEITDGYCLKTIDNSHLIYYKENSDFIEMDISKASGSLSSVAIDTKKKYREIKVDTDRGRIQWVAPYKSDWAIAVYSSKRE
jgi:hypothetical protein